MLSTSLLSKFTGLLYISSVLFMVCHTACKTSATSASPSNAHQQYTNAELPSVEESVHQLVKCLNERDESCLLALYHPEYKSYSPVLTPADPASFVRQTLDNLRKNNFSIQTRIKEIEQGADLASVVMNWQLQVRGKDRDDAPFAKVQRIDLWKLDKHRKWRIFRTVIYNEKAF